MNHPEHFQILMKIILLLILCETSYIFSSKILVLAPFNAPSHWLMFQKIIDELLNRGHEVTAITNYVYHLNNTNYTGVVIDAAPQVIKYYTSEDSLAAEPANEFSTIAILYKLGIDTSRGALTSPAVRKFIKREDLQFDLIISEQFFQECFLMFGHKFKAPIITISTYGYSDFMDKAMGLHTPWSHVPHSFLCYNDPMTFLQRCYNVITSMYDLVYRKYFYMPIMNRMAMEHFKSLKKYGPLPYVEELEKNISVILINDHSSIRTPKPQISGLVDIGGIHILKPKPLPEDLQSILDKSDNGVIYFSLGAYLKSSKMTSEKVRLFLDVFSQMEQTILWKWENENVPDVPKNVILRKWMPQGDILAHKNVILFISHGGLYGTMESIHYGIPMLFMPFYGDQHRNVIYAKAAGYGLVLNFNEITAATLNSTLKEMVTNKKYFNNAKSLSNKFRDNLVPPMEKAIYWIEYVIRHKGAPHLKSKAVHLSWFTYNCLDVYFSFISLLLLVGTAIYSMINSVFHKIKDSSIIKKPQKKNE